MSWEDYCDWNNRGSKDGGAAVNSVKMANASEAAFLGSASGISLSLAAWWICFNAAETAGYATHGNIGAARTSAKAMDSKFENIHTALSTLCNFTDLTTNRQNLKVLDTLLSTSRFTTLTNAVEALRTQT